jgi:hypothetical protein
MHGSQASSSCFRLLSGILGYLSLMSSKRLARLRASVVSDLYSPVQSRPFAPSAQTASRKNVNDAQFL